MVLFFLGPYKTRATSPRPELQKQDIGLIPRPDLQDHIPVFVGLRPVVSQNQSLRDSDHVTGLGIATFDANILYYYMKLVH